MNLTYIKDYYISIRDIINLYLVPLLFAVALIVFLWGIYQYFIQGAANEESQKKGRTFALYGIIGLVIISSVWGLVRIVTSTFIPSTVSNSAPPSPTIDKAK